MPQESPPTKFISAKASTASLPAKTAIFPFSTPSHSPKTTTWAMPNSWRESMVSKPTKTDSANAPTSELRRKKLHGIVEQRYATGFPMAWNHDL